MSVIISLLNKAGVDYRHYSKAEIQIDCPFCEDIRGTVDSHKCLGINQQKFVAHCLRCDWAADGLTSVLKALSRKFGVTFSYREMLKDMEEEYEPPVHKPKPCSLPVGFERFIGSDDEYEVKAKQYLRSRGIGRIEIAKYRIGYAAAGEMAGRVIFPVMENDGRVYGYVGRDFTGNLKPKYLNSKGIKMLWNAQEKGEAAALCEGIISAIAVAQALRSEGVVGLATLGCGLDAYQLSQLERYKRIIVFTEADEAGVRETLTHARRIATAGLQCQITVPRRLDDSDPRSLPADAVRKLHAAAIPWGKSAEYRLRRLRRSAF